MALLLLLTLTVVALASSRGFIVYLPKLPTYCGDYTLFVLEISRDHSMMLRGEAVKRGELEVRLRDAFKTRAERLLFIRADRHLKVREVMEVIDVASRQAEYIALITPSVEREAEKRPYCGLEISLPSDRKVH